MSEFTAIEDLAINIIISDDGPNAQFVEIENDKGESVQIGIREDHDGDLTKIRITVSDIIDNIKI